MSEVIEQSQSTVATASCSLRIKPVAAAGSMTHRLAPFISSARARRLPLATILAASFACGIALGWHQPQPLVRLWIWLAATCVVMGVVAGMALRRWRWLVIVCGSLAMVTSGIAWVTLQQRYAPANDLMARIGSDPIPLRARGVALGPPVIRARTAGSLARFDYRPPATYFPMRIDELCASDGRTTHPIHGQVLVRVDQTVPPFHAGDYVQAIGLLIKPAVPENPGEFNYLQYARSLGQAGILIVSDRTLLNIEYASRNDMLSRIMRWRQELRNHASGWLLADLPEMESSLNRDTGSLADSLLVNLLLGQRDAQIDGWYGSFQRVGLAHVMAISGFHMGVLAGYVLLIARFFTGYRRWHGWIVIATVLLYLVLVEAHMPVLRAGIMTIAASLGMVTGRRLKVGGLVSLSAVPLLLWRPDELFNAGFQLTYAVVLALVYLTQPVHRRWFRPSRRDPATVGEMALFIMKKGLVVSVVAWMVATPIAAYHFGIVSLAGIAMSILITPIAAMLLALGYTKMILHAFFPSLGLLLGVPLSIGANILLVFVKSVDAIKIGTLHVPFPTTLWSLSALAWVIWWCVARPRFRWHRHLMWIIAAALCIWLCLPVLPGHSQPSLRVDMISVGDGSCYLLRSRDQAAVFDAGSSTDLDAGRRTIIPALRHLNVRAIEAIAVSHADMDHYSAVLELIGEFSVQQVFLTPQFIREASQQPQGPAAYVIDCLTQKNVAIRTRVEGDHWELGESRWTWLNPQPDVEYDKTNNSSMVIQIEACAKRMLLCGDIQQETINRLVQSNPALASDVMELPHHGSFNDQSARLVKDLHPSIVLQSTGGKRFRSDRWSGVLAFCTRLVTVRDGACWVEIGRDGSIASGCFAGADHTSK
jgi:competence protein ComEC